MSDPDCADRVLIIQADLDGELDTAEAARLATHVAGCARCRAVQAELASLSVRLRADLPTHPAPDRLRRSLEARLAPPSRQQGRRSVAIGGALALAASVALALVPRTPQPDTSSLDDAAVAGHIRALQPGHLTDVVSTDQHTVKPWFDGKLDFAPPVKDLAAARFPMLGGRLDYLADRPVAAIVYGRDKHLIDLFVWPDPTARAPATSVRNGYNVVSWSADGMALLAVSDLNAGGLADFARLWMAAP